MHKNKRLSIEVVEATVTQALGTHLLHHEVDTVIDIDLSNFFGTIDHQMLKDMLCEKIKDKRFIRYISRMFKAGVLTDGELSISDEGVPQGSICSPVLANIYAHYVIDTWFQTVAKRHCRRRVELFRYARVFKTLCQPSSLIG
ncbi:reverse transcriptase domain-containing protein [Microbulbifer sp. 2304DJ12-6]|uniref:reverse transcriptase domain-containing protein n=1 Tax=Microbulbifer sp. 2304DJ12-6 TaxID=3233340 RepID=UPI0039B0CD58